MERKFPTAAGQEQLDAARFYFEHQRYMFKYLPRCHKALLADDEIQDAIPATQIAG